MKTTLRILRKLIGEALVKDRHPPEQVKIGDVFDIVNKAGIATVTVQDIVVVYTENGSSEAVITYQYEVNNRYGTNSSGASEFRKLWGLK